MDLDLIFQEELPLFFSSDSLICLNFDGKNYVMKNHFKRTLKKKLILK